MEFWPQFLAHDAVREFIAGGIGGMAGVVAGHPMDTIRIRLQQPRPLGSTAPINAMTILRQTVHAEGPFALFKGMTSPLTTIAFQNAVSFKAYATFARLLSREGDSINGEPASFPSVALAGMGAGFVQTVILTPVDLVKIQLQVDTHPVSAPKISKPKLGIGKANVPGSHFSSSSSNKSSSSTRRRLNPDQNLNPIQVVQNILRREGVRGLYRGLGVTMIRDAPSHAIYFGTYEYARELLHPGCRSTGDEGLLTMLTAGGLAGSLSWLSCYPIDIAKSRLQAQSTDKPPKYRGLVDCLRKSVAAEGWQVLWRGLGLTMVRAFIVNGAIFSAYEMSLRFL